MSYYFRVDSNENIGIGHMMRCLSIARAMRRMGQEATFFVADKKSAAIAAQNGFGYYCLNSDYDHPDVEADKFIQIIRDRDAQNLLVDSYYVTENYLNKIREVTNLTYIDDINRFIYPCDLLINYNIYAESLDYEKRYRAAGLIDTEFALGLSYMPLRDEYRDLYLRKKPHEGIRIMITTGATDKFNVIGKILEKAAEEGLIVADGRQQGKDLYKRSSALKDRNAAKEPGEGEYPDEKNNLNHLSGNLLDDRLGVNDLEFDVILGQYNEHKGQLIKEFTDFPQVHLLEPQPTLAGLIASSDIAVTAGGTTVYELCAGGLASVMLTIADNQMRAAKAFSSQEIIPYAGDVRDDLDGVAARVVRQIEAYAADPSAREAAGEKMRHVVDGRGADRLAELLIGRMR